VTRLFVSKRRSRAANDVSRVIPAQAGIECLCVVIDAGAAKDARLPSARERHIRGDAA